MDNSHGSIVPEEEIALFLLSFPQCQALGRDACGVKQIFEKVANQGQSGRTVKHWLDRIEFTIKNGKRLALSKIYATLKNTFYYGDFEYPLNSNNWYKGKHEPLVTKELFDKAQIQIQVPEKSYHTKIFPFKKIFICGGCKGGITAEEKFRKLKYGGHAKHMILNIDKIEFNFSGMSRKINEDIERYID